jgi:hypothetical protein
MITPYDSKPLSPVQYVMPDGKSTTSPFVVAESEMEAGQAPFEMFREAWGENKAKTLSELNEVLTRIINAQELKKAAACLDDPQEAAVQMAQHQDMIDHGPEIARVRWQRGYRAGTILLKGWPGKLSNAQMLQQTHEEMIGQLVQAATSIGLNPRHCINAPATMYNSQEMQESFGEELAIAQRCRIMLSEKFTPPRDSVREPHHRANYEQLNTKPTWTQADIRKAMQVI